ncbi:unnamed protein product [Clavelina lepadiformis]|uniref:Uncharacterized protein n=1 Tax=Clavelina lepadiformis TaxID=159417 RepID=A0ABP0GX78_CLALP
MSTCELYEKDEDECETIVCFEPDLPIHKLDIITNFRRKKFLENNHGIIYAIHAHPEMEDDSDYEIDFDNDNDEVFDSDSEENESGFESLEDYI